VSPHSWFDAPAPPEPARQPPSSPDRRAVVAGGAVLVVLVLLAAGLVALIALDRSGGLPGAAQVTPPPGGYTYASLRAAPPLELTDQDGRPFALTSLRGAPVLVFFGYTHCPDVCPATVGILNQVLAEVGAGPRVVFTSIDPERDDVAAMASYLRYLPKAYVGLSGTPAQVRAMADGWGVKYARVETGSAGGYSMAHTADVFLVDAAGRLRAHFPFGTAAGPMEDALKALLAEPPATPAPATLAPPVPVSPAPTAAPASAPQGSVPPASGASLTVTLVSSSVWAGGASPVILTLADAAGTALDGTVAVRAHVTSLLDGSVAGPDVTAVAVRPPGLATVDYVATVDIPSPGAWRLDLTAASGATGSVRLTALDPGATAKLGSAAPDVRTPTLADVGGLAIAITTAPDPDLRFSRASTADARAAGQPYVLVIDSVRFKVSPACGRALTMARYLLDRWPDVAFIHLEPFVYQIVTSEPVLSGDITDPPLNRWTRAWGIGDATWTALNMPWIFVVDGQGIVRAKYTGIIGSADVDVIVSMIRGQGIVGG
jgi:protein SCO1/2